MKYLKYLLGLILLLVIIFFAKGLLTPSIYYESEVTVDKPANESWAVMSDEANLPKWIKGFKRTEHISGDVNQIGEISKVYVEDQGQEMIMEQTIIDVRKNELLAMSFKADFMDMEYDMLFDEKDGKTTIKTKSTTVGNGIFAKSLVSFMTSSMKTMEDANLESLKKLIEENTKEYFQVSKIDTTLEMTK